MRNIVMLDRRASVPGTGWGCVVCDLPSDGASYVACDKCLEENAPPKEVARGFLGDGDREPIEHLSPEPFEHDLTKHKDWRT